MLNKEIKFKCPVFGYEETTLDLDENSILLNKLEWRTGMLNPEDFNNKQFGVPNETIEKYQSKGYIIDTMFQKENHPHKDHGWGYCYVYALKIKGSYEL